MRGISINFFFHVFFSAGADKAVVLWVDEKGHSLEMSDTVSAYLRVSRCHSLVSAGRRVAGGRQLLSGSYDQSEPSKPM